MTITASAVVPFSVPIADTATGSGTDIALLVWDNRSLMHRALHTTQPEPAVSFRVTVQDGRHW